jgi:bla regulator protein BlaR1
VDAAQATVLIGALWLLGRCVPRLAPAMRCMLWWLVAAQLLLGLAVSRPVELRWLSPAGKHPDDARGRDAHRHRRG